MLCHILNLLNMFLNMYLAIARWYLIVQDELCMVATSVLLKFEKDTNYGCSCAGTNGSNWDGFLAISKITGSVGPSQNAYHKTEVLVYYSEKKRVNSFICYTFINASRQNQHFDITTYCFFQNGDSTLASQLIDLFHFTYMLCEIPCTQFQKITGSSFSFYVRFHVHNFWQQLAILFSCFVRFHVQNFSTTTGNLVLERLYLPPPLPTCHGSVHHYTRPAH